MDVRAAVRRDEGGLLALAAGVEQWFGPMVADPEFLAALRRNIERGSAFVVCGAGDRVLGGILTGGGAPSYRINWLVVDEAARRHRVGQALVDHVTRRCQGPGTIEVVTFGEDHPGAQSSGARAFYERLGFVAGAAAADGPEGGSRQRFCLTLA